MTAESEHTGRAVLKPDRRQQKTRTAILTAFSQLLGEKKYSHITVQDIIDRANVGRSTFYAHFETRDDLLKALCDELFEHVILRSRHEKDKETAETAGMSIFEHILSHLQNHNGELLRLLCSENDDLFVHFFKDRMRELIEDILQNKEKKDFHGVPVEYVANHIAASFVETVLWWTKKASNLTPKQVDVYFHEVVGHLI